MTYLWFPAVPIVVTLHEGVPVAFYWNGKTHPVLWVAQQWRADVEWWRFHIWRDSYKLVTGTGLLVVVYCDLLEGSWYLQQVYD